VISAGAALTAYILPDSLISVTASSKTPPLSPGDFTRGLEGPLFAVRDLMLVIYVFLSLIYSIYHIIKKSRSFQSVAMFLGIVIAILGGVDDMQYLYSGNNLFLNNLRFSRFVLGSTIMLLFFLAAVFSKYFTAHTMLQKTTREMQTSENKYSLLMDAANEIMFSLSEDLTIISANKKAEHLFRLSGEEKNFMDCLYRNDNESKADNNFFKEQLVELREAGEKLAINTYIMDPVTKEPVEYHFRFDCFHDEKNLELIGRAWPTAASKLVDYVGIERLSLDVDNYITMVSDIVDRLTANTKRYLEEGDIMMIKMGLQEMIVNAMEHGNLNVTFDEKTKAQEEGRLFEFMSERRVQPEYRDRKVSIDYYFDETKVIYRITDMGPGFDYENIMNRVKNEVNQQGLTHGRGIIMTQAVFDKVEYNIKGNQVLLIKEFRKGDAA
jgi:anti-sigma regulatory factor (Ser/Thr protein kinase)